MVCAVIIRRLTDYVHTARCTGLFVERKIKIMRRARSVRELAIAKRRLKTAKRKVVLPYRVEPGRASKAFWDFFDSLPKSARDYLNYVPRRGSEWNAAYQSVLRKYWRG